MRHKSANCRRGNASRNRALIAATHGSDKFSATDNDVLRELQYGGPYDIPIEWRRHSLKRDVAAKASDVQARLRIRNRDKAGVIAEPKVVQTTQCAIVVTPLADLTRIFVCGPENSFHLAQASL